MKATWKNVVLAESNETIIIENNHYFPDSALNRAYFKPSNTHTFCPWKGEENPDAAWFYPNPKPAASQIKDYVAFWKGVQITA